MNISVQYKDLGTVAGRECVDSVPEAMRVLGSNWRGMDRAFAVPGDQVSVCFTALR